MADLLSRLKTALADRYRVERELGAGGMATVYLATDLKHERQVAIKVLKPELSAILGAERFLHEIKVTANLQHPNILPLYDSGEADSFLYYVMPYVEGETLRERLKREKQLSVEDAVEIAKDATAALTLAHSHGVIHRDIKPENILLASGQAIVADFGIALAVRTAGGERLTESGLSLGTPQYMSPEQATGDRELDARTDVYSLGCVVYEMLVGDPPHSGSTVQAVVARVLSETPRPIATTRELVPPNVDAAVQRALAKTPADRFASAAQFADALTNPAFTAPTITGTVAPPATRSDWRKRFAISLAALAVVASTLLVWPMARERQPRVIRYGLDLPPGQEFVDIRELSFTLSPDGSNFVYAGPGPDGRGQQLWVKPLDRYEATPLLGTTMARQPVISPDGEWVSYSVDTELKKMPLGGGASTTLSDSVETLYGGVTWLDDDTIVYIGFGDHHLRQVPASGGVAERMWTPQEVGRYPILPFGLPDGRGVLFTYCDDECLTVQELWVFDPRVGDARMIMPEVARGWYVPTGHLVYVRPDGALLAVPFDLGELEVRGDPVPLLDGVKVDAGIMPDLALSASGQLAYIRGAFALSDYELVWVDRGGNTTQIDSTWTFQSGVGEHGWRLSPDDTRLAIKIATDAGADIWVKQMDQGPLSRVTFDEAFDLRPRWTPDGLSVTFVSNRAGEYDLYAKRSDGSGQAELLVDVEAQIWEGVTAPDGEGFVVRTSGEDGQRDLWMFRSDSLHPLVVTPADERAAEVSSDGGWLAYESDETGRPEVYVRPFPETAAGKWQVSSDGGIMPLWSKRGTELFYVSGAREMMVADVQPGPPFIIGERRVLFEIASEILVSEDLFYTVFDVSRDGRRFLMARQIEGEAPVHALVLVENWFEELKAKVGK